VWLYLIIRRLSGEEPPFSFDCSDPTSTRLFSVTLFLSTTSFSSSVCDGLPLALSGAAGDGGGGENQHHQVLRSGSFGILRYSIAQASSQGLHW